MGFLASAASFSVFSVEWTMEVNKKQSADIFGANVRTIQNLHVRRPTHRSWKYQRLCWSGGNRILYFCAFTDCRWNCQYSRRNTPVVQQHFLELDNRHIDFLKRDIIKAMNKATALDELIRGRVNISTAVWKTVMCQKQMYWAFINFAAGFISTWDIT